MPTWRGSVAKSCNFCRIKVKSEFRIRFWKELGVQNFGIRAAPRQIRCVQATRNVQCAGRCADQKFPIIADCTILMHDVPAAGEAALEVISPDNSRHRMRVSESPFFIGRNEEGNHLQISDKRISRQCAAIVREEGRYYLEDRGNTRGVFINRGKIARQALEDGDVVTFGLDDSAKLVFHCTESDTASIQNLLTRMENVTETDAPSGGLGKLNLLLEATRLLHSQLPLDAVLDAMLDRAIAITDADRGLLLEADSAGALRQRLARRKGPTSLPAEGFSPSQTAVGLAMEQQSGVITEDVHQEESVLQGAQSIIAQALRAVVAIPLYAMPFADTGGIHRPRAARSIFSEFCTWIRGVPRRFPSSIARFWTPLPSKRQHPGQCAPGEAGSRTGAHRSGIEHRPGHPAGAAPARLPRLSSSKDHRHELSMPRGRRRLFRCFPDQ